MAIAQILHGIKIGVSPLTKRINLYRMGKSATDALETRDATGEIYGAVIEHMMDGAPEGKGMTATIRSGDKAWDVTVRPVGSITPAGPQEAAAEVISGYSGDPDSRGSKSVKVLNLEHLPVGTKLYPPV